MEWDETEPNRWETQGGRGRATVKLRDDTTDTSDRPCPDKPWLWTVELEDLYADGYTSDDEAACMEAGRVLGLFRSMR